MYRRSFISGLFATGLLPALPSKPGPRLAQAARNQVGVTTG